MKLIRYYIGLLLIGLLLPACQSETEEIEPDFVFSSPNVGALILEDMDVNEMIPVTITKAADFSMLDVSQFIIEIYKEGSSSYYSRYETFDDLKKAGMPLELPVGNYIIKAFSYDSIPVLREKPYFLGEAKLAIEAHEISAVKVECKYQSIGVEFVLTQAFKNFFHDNYTITVSTDNDVSAVYSLNSPERMYFTQNCNYLRVQVECETKDNEIYTPRVYYFNKEAEDPSFNGDGPFKGEYFIIQIDTDQAVGRSMIAQ